MRIIFAGTPDFACESLIKLIASEHEVVAVYTQPDRTKGRNRKLYPSPVKQLALAHNIPVEQPINFREQAIIERFKSYRPDIFVVAAYGLLLPSSVLSVTGKNINVHASLLPNWRGASPIQSAILNGDLVTGVTIMEIIKELDAGAIINSASLAITNTSTAESLSEQLSKLGAKLLLETIDNFSVLWPARIAQVDRYSSHAPKITKEMARINWNLTAQAIDQMIRAFIPWPVAYSSIGANIVKIYKIEILASSELKPGCIRKTKDQILVGTGTNDVSILELQLANKARMPIKSVLCGNSELFSEDFQSQ